MFRILCFVLLWLAPAPPDDALAKLERNLERLRVQKAVLQGELVNEMRTLVADVRLAWSVDPSRAVEAATVLLDVMGYFLDASEDPAHRTPEAELRDAASEALLAHLDGAFARWLSTEVLVLSRTQPLDRRLAVARLFERSSVPAGKLALLECTNDREPRMRNAALSALAGWSDEAVNALFLRELERSLKGDAAAAGALAEKHFSSVRFDERSKYGARLGELVRTGLVSDDWRITTRSILLSAPLSNESIVPFLIEALAAWKQRADQGLQALRIRFELQRALRDRSGRAFGTDPEVWREWWRLVRAGKLRTGGAGPAAMGESTEASFFGIRPMTDRVTFVIDRSGSMAQPFGIGTRGGMERAHRRWDEARTQLLALLQSMGERTRFNVILFHDFAEGWKESLVPATKDNLRSLREWLEFQKPNGGTQLRAGVDRALRLRPDGTIDLATLETDTVIVLCDGQTAEGSGWVDPFLRALNATARIVFHGVQIGSQGDDTMSKLARGSRGDFARIDG